MPSLISAGQTQTDVMAALCSALHLLALPTGKQQLSVPAQRSLPDDHLSFSAYVPPSDCNFKLATIRHDDGKVSVNVVSPSAPGISPSNTRTFPHRKGQKEYHLKINSQEENSFHIFCLQGVFLLSLTLSSSSSCCCCLGYVRQCAMKVQVSGLTD